MLNCGKHAEISLDREQERVFKTYKNSMYVDNELFALKFLAKAGILDLKPNKESEYTLSFNWLNDNVYSVLSEKSINSSFLESLVEKLKKLHINSFKEFGYFLTHEDLFADNILLRKSDNAINIIDWGLSGKRSNIYPDIASLALGIFNKNPQAYRSFLKLYFDSDINVDFGEIQYYAEFLYNEYLNIRLENCIEIDSLKERLSTALQVIKEVENSY